MTIGKCVVSGAPASMMIDGKPYCLYEGKKLLEAKAAAKAEKSAASTKPPPERKTPKKVKTALKGESER